MKYLDQSFAEPAANLACDEWLLERAKCGQERSEVLRVCESQKYFVVLGRARKIAADVDLSACAHDGVPILRRASGGGTVLQGPGCLNYSLVLDLAERQIGGLLDTFAFVLQRHRKLIAELIAAEISLAGVSDLTLENRKFSGNAQYRKRNFVLVHGTFLLAFDLTQCESLLRIPAEQPAYRSNRRHTEFLTNIGSNASLIKEKLKSSWSVSGDIQPVRTEDVRGLVDSRYADESWTRKF